MKRTLAILLVCALAIISYLSPSLASNETVVSGEWKYQLLSEGSIAITNYIGSAEKVTVPIEIDGREVADIIGNPFMDCTTLSEISVSLDHQYLASIDGVLFCKADKRLVCFPASLGIKEYSIPTGIQIIGDYAFAGCKSLQSVRIPGSVTRIGKGAFFKSNNISKVIIPDSVTDIGKFAFYRCGSLTATVSEHSYPEEYCINNNLQYNFEETIEPETLTNGDWEYTILDDNKTI